ncbi:MAG: Inositol-1-monophosphatase [Parcubacteria group bacterium GW2011_GWB1_40_14]|nr:MAG: Inositol-1-monophosphatase [Parcubacteria group bacterium GW2011_GWB1_40_14]
MMQREEIARKLIVQASAELRDIYNKGDIVRENKDIDGSIVTYADKEIENFLVEGIKKYFPNDIIIAEEGSGGANDIFSAKDKFIWFIDPIDGTRNFVSGIPFFAISIGLMEDESLKFGIISEPLQENVFYAERGKGAFKNDVPMRVMPGDDMDENLIILGFIGKRNRIATANLLNKLVRTRVLGSAALNLCLVAQGKALGNIGLGFHTWDIAAGIIIVEEAGGKISDESGKSINIFQRDPLNIIATNGSVHDKILKEVNIAEKQPILGC